jgi:hypothetical protein
MYYVWEKALKREDEFAFFGKRPPGFRAKPWISGERIAEPPTIELVGDSDSPTTLSDVLLTGFELEVLSPRLVSLLADMGIQNVQYLPITIIDHETKRKETSYRIANILGAIDCLDLKNSQHSLAPDDSSVVLSVSKFRIHTGKIVALPGMREPPLLFRLGEFKRHILVHESVKEACTKAKISGLDFTPPEVYV